MPVALARCVAGPFLCGAAVAAGLLSMAACGARSALDTEGVPPPEDGGHGSGTDARTEAATEAGVEAGTEAGTEAGPDGGPDGARDGGVTLLGGCSVSAAVAYNGNFELGNVGFCSGYNYVPPSSLIVIETEYTVATDPSTVSRYPDWVRFGDHTSGHGKMLIANGATVPSTPVWSQTYVVQPNTTYVFSFWAASVNAVSQSLAVLQAFVGPNAAGPAVTLPSQPGQWRQVTTTWSSGSSTTVTFSIRDLNTKAGWNDFAVDDVSFGP
jgi:hypothetical protein